MVVAERHPERIAAFFDVDRTLVHGSSMLALAGPLRRAGLLSNRSAIRAVIQGLQFSACGFTEKQVQRAVRHMGDAVRGMEAAAVRRVSDRAVPRVVGPRVYPEAIDLIVWHRRHGHLVFLVSASTRDLIDRLAEIVGADGVVASEAEVVGGRYTGAVSLCQGAAKAMAVRRLAETHAIDLQRSYAYGDSEADVSMLRAVGHPTTVNADRRLRAAARQQGWPQLRFHPPDRQFQVDAHGQLAAYRVTAQPPIRELVEPAASSEVSAEGAGTPVY